MEKEKKESFLKKLCLLFNKKFDKNTDIPIHINFDVLFRWYFCIFFIVLPIIPYFPGALVDMHIPNETKIGIITIATVIFWALHVIYLDFKKKISLSKLPLADCAIILYLILVLLSSLVSKYAGDALFGTLGRNEGLLTIFTYFAIFKLFQKYFKFDLRIYTLVNLSVSLLSLYAVYQVTVFKYISNYIAFDGQFAYVSMGNPNFLSAYLTMFLPMFMLSYMETGKKQYFLSSVITFCALVTSSTSSGYLVFGIYFVICLIYGIIKKKVTGIVRFIPLVISFVILAIALNISSNGLYLKEYTSIDNQIESATKGDNSGGNFRIEIYKVVLDSIKENPLMGIGVDCLGEYINEKNEGKFILNGQVSYLDKAHSEYLHIAVSTGIPSLICYLTFLIAIAVSMLKAYIKKPSNYVLFIVGISIAMYLIQATFNISTVQVTPTFWALLGIGASLAKKELS